MIRYRQGGWPEVHFSSYLLCAEGQGEKEMLKKKEDASQRTTSSVERTCNARIRRGLLSIVMAAEENRQVPPTTSGSVVVRGVRATSVKSFENAMGCCGLSGGFLWKTESRAQRRHSATLCDNREFSLSCAPLNAKI